MHLPLVCAKGRHVKSFERIRHFHSDLFSEASGHVEALNMDNQNIGQLIEALRHDAFLVFLATTAVPAQRG